MSNETTLSIVASDLINYSLQLQEAILKGYRISVQNEYTPYTIGYSICATLVRESVVDEMTIKVTVDAEQAIEALKQASEAIASDDGYTFEKFAEASLKIDADVSKKPARGRK